MTIAVITDKYTEEQLTAFFPGENLHLVLLREAQPVPDAEAYFDLDFIPTPARCETLNRLQPALIIVNAVIPTIKQLGYAFVRINGWPRFLERNIHELAVPDDTTARRIADL